MEKSKLYIFDMDGTLFDTSESNFLAYKEAAASVGYEIDRDKFLKVFVGKNYKEFLPLFGINEEGELHQIHEYKKAHYREFVPYIKMNERLFDLIRESREKGDAIIALATTASRKNTEDILKCFKVEGLFDIVLTQEEVSKLKPDPECYLKVMEMAGISSDNTTIYEDSKTGIMAAIASGAKVVEVHDFCL